MNVLGYSKYLLFVVLIAVISTTCKHLSISDELDINCLNESEQKMKGWLDFLCSEECAGRYVGTEGNKKACDYIIAQLSSMGYSPSIQEFTFSDVTLHNVIVSIPGEKDSCIVVGAHYDGQFPSKVDAHYPAANDNASGVVTLLKIANDIVDINFKCTYGILLCFWDGEENTLGKCFKGSDYYVTNCSDLKIKYYHNLDSVGHDHEKKYKVQYYGNWPEQIVLPYIKNKFALNYTNISSQNKGEGSSDYVSFSKEGIPYINITNDHSSGCGNRFHSTEDTPNAISIPLLCTMASIVEDAMQL